MGIHWLLIAAVVLIKLQNWLYNRFGLNGLTYERFFETKACFPGEEAVMVERIANRKLLPVSWVRLESMMHAHLRFPGQAGLEISSGELFQNHRSLFSLMPYTQIIRRHRITCLKRGCYRLDSATLTVGDMVGLTSGRKSLSLQAELLVYPKPANADELLLPHHSWQGDFSVRRWMVDDPFVYSGVREYRYGDPLNSIHWKATARSSRLQVHQRDYTAEHRLMIYVNVEDHEQMWNQVNEAELFERGLSYAAALAQRAIERGMETGFGTNAHQMDVPRKPVVTPAAGGWLHLEWLLQTMARLVAARAVSFDVLLEQEANRGLTDHDIVIFSAYMSPKIEMQLDRLRRNGNAVECLLIGLDSGAKAGAGA